MDVEDGLTQSGIRQFRQDSVSMLEPEQIDFCQEQETRQAP
jgi:hypothetical protein